MQLWQPGQVRPAPSDPYKAFQTTRGFPSASFKCCAFPSATPNFAMPSSDATDCCGYNSNPPNTGEIFPVISKGSKSDVFMTLFPDSPSSSQLFLRYFPTCLSHPFASSLPPIILFRRWQGAGLLVLQLQTRKIFEDQELERTAPKKSETLDLPSFPPPTKKPRRHHRACDPACDR